MPAVLAGDYCEFPHSGYFLGWLRKRNRPALEEPHHRIPSCQKHDSCCQVRSRIEHFVKSYGITLGCPNYCSWSLDHTINVIGLAHQRCMAKTKLLWRPRKAVSVVRSSSASVDSTAVKWTREDTGVILGDRSKKILRITIKYYALHLCPAHAHKIWHACSFHRSAMLLWDKITQRFA